MAFFSAQKVVISGILLTLERFFYNIFTVSFIANGHSPNGKAADSESAIYWFEPNMPNNCFKIKRNILAVNHLISGLFL